MGYPNMSTLFLIFKEIPPIFLLRANLRNVKQKIFKGGVKYEI
jgi:hypothetical protein